MFERTLQVRAHHGVVHDDDSARSLLLDVAGDSREVDDLDQGVGGGFEQDERGLRGVDVWADVLCVCGVYMVDGDADMRLDEGEEAVGAPVQIVASNDLVSGL